jgi:hypothetical protein
MRIPPPRESTLQVLLPDLKQLPSLLDPSLHTRLQSVSSEGPRERKSAALVSDDEFVAQFAEQKLPSWGHVQRLRVLCVGVFALRCGQPL